MDNNNYETDPIDNMTFTKDKCFLCGEELNSENRTDEHVYPQWLQKMFKLRERELILLNETKIKYRQLTIPCCKKCNAIMGEKIENPMREAVGLGYEHFLELDRKIIFQWLNKLAYGMLFKELSLKSEIKNFESEKIYSEENLKKHYMQHIFLKTIIDGSEFIHQPWSILVFKIRPDNEQNLYWAHDNPIFKNFFIRMNDIGIISNLMDNGYQEEYFLKNNPEYTELFNKGLHPIQFEEVCANFAYMSGFFNINPLYFTFSDSNKKINTLMSEPVSGIVSENWDEKLYSQILYRFWEHWGIPYDKVYDKNKGVLTYLRNPDGSFLDMFKINNI